MNIFRLIFIAIMLRIRLLNCEREYNGKIVEPGEYPFLVSIVRADSTPDTFGYCLGTIISPNWILTSGFCGDKKTEYLIEHGAWWANETKKLPPVSHYIPHPKYDGTTIYNVALLRTETPIKFDRFTMYVPLISQTKQIPINIEAFSIAWGSGEDLEVFNSTLLETRRGNTLATADNFPYSYKSQGAPILYDGYQIGLLISKEGQNNSHIYSDLSVHLDWIYKAINFYDFKEEYSYLKRKQPNCTGTPDSNNILDICCMYQFRRNLIELCVSLE